MILMIFIFKMDFAPFILFRDYFTLINTTFIKDFSLLGRRLNDIIILDNNLQHILNHYNFFPIWFDYKNELLKYTHLRIFKLCS